MQKQKWAALLLGCNLLGCLSADTLPTGPATGRAAISRTSTRNDEFDLNSFKQASPELAAHNAESTQAQLLEIPPGTQIHLVDQANRRYIGVLLSASSDDVRLKNCVCREIVSAPDEQQQCKTSHVPFQTLKTDSLTHLTVVSAAPPDFDADRAEDSSDVTVDTLVFKNGRRQRWGQPSDPGLLNRAIEASTAP